jgi:Flp pilus assembly protein TadD
MAEQTRKQQIEAMLAEEPNDPFLRYGLAMEYVSAGDDEGAGRCFQELTTLAPDYVPAYLQNGQALMRLGRTEEARSVLKKGINVARKQGNDHAAGEMEGFLDGLD